MKTTLGKLKQLIREAAEGQSPKQIGTLSAHIGMDHSYSDNLSVYYNPKDDTVTLVVSDTAPVGGMDYDSGGKVNSGETVRKTVKADPKLVMMALKDILMNDQHLFRRYGKPSKNFNWPGVGKGLNATFVTQAIAKAQGKEVKARPAKEVPLDPFAKTWDETPADVRAKVVRQTLDYDGPDAVAVGALPWTDAVKEITNIGDVSDVRRIKKALPMYVYSANRDPQ